MVGGHVPLGIVAPTVAVPHVQSKRLIALAVTSPKRLDLLPEVPTMAESGAPGFHIEQWYAVWLPAKTPRAIVDKLHAEVVRIVQAPDYRQRQHEVATEVVGSTPEALAEFQKSEIDKYRKIGAAAGIKPE